VSPARVVLVLLALVAVLGQAAWAATASVVLHIEGMTCGS
jgi:hypothetical protein